MPGSGEDVAERVRVFETVVRWALETLRSFGSPGLAFLLFLESFLLPVPSEVVLPFAGVLVGRGYLNFWLALFASTLGTLSGVLFWYWLGRWGGRALVLRHGRLVRMNARDLDRAEGWFSRYGDYVVLVARIVPVLRGAVSLPAGVSKMTFGRFALFSAAGSALWNAALISAGRILGAEWQRVSGWVDRYSHGVLVVLAAAVALFLYRRFRKDRKDEKTRAGSSG